jgi:hypothetical protein
LPKSANRALDAVRSGAILRDSLIPLTAAP